MKRKKVEKSIREAIVAEYLAGGVSLRDLSEKYGYSYAIIGVWVKASKDLPHVIALAEKLKESSLEPVGQVSFEEYTVLEDQLRMANLKNQILEAMLDIGKEQYGIDLRKKSGTKQS